MLSRLKRPSEYWTYRRARDQGETLTETKSGKSVGYCALAYDKCFWGVFLVYGRESKVGNNIHQDCFPFFFLELLNKNPHNF